MKQLFNFIKPVALLMVLSMTYMLSSCSEETTGDRTYQLKCGETYNEEVVCTLANIQGIISSELQKVSKLNTDINVYMISGKFNECDKTMTSAVNKAMDAIEATEAYKSATMLKGIRITLKLTSGESVYVRAFK